MRLDKFIAKIEECNFLHHSVISSCFIAVKLFYKVTVSEFVLVQ